MSEQEAPEQKKKRTTIADLKRDLQEVEKVVGEDILEGLADHEVRIGDLEKAVKEKPDSAVTNVTDRLTALEDVTGNLLQNTMHDHDKRLTALENATGALADAVRDIAAGDADWGTRMEDAEDSIHSLQAAISDMQESATHTEPVPLPRPVQESPGQAYLATLKAIAQQSQNMGDVLHMTRVLQAAGELSDDQKRQIMSIACMAAGVDYAENLLRRAGVRSFEA